MTDQFTREELEELGFSRLYADCVSGRLPSSLSTPEFLGKEHMQEFAAGAAAVSEKPFWREILKYNERLGASKESLRNAQDLLEGKAVPVVTGQQPGLLGGPLYTLYKALTAVVLAKRLAEGGSIGVDKTQRVPLRAVPVLWNASDDSDFHEVASTTFFERDLSLKKLSIASSNHLPGQMVGAIRTEALNTPIEELMHGFDKPSATVFLMSSIEDCLAVARDWGEFFSALFLRLFSHSGLVLVDSRLPSVAAHSARVIDSYLREAGSIELRVAERLAKLRELGYDEPVSQVSGEACVFRRDGISRKKISKSELSAIAGLWKEGAVELLPNVLLGPVVRDELMEPVVNIVGPSELSYYIVSRVLYEVLGLRQRPIFPRLSLTLLPRELTFLVEGDPNGFKKLVVSFDNVTRDYFEKRMPPEVARDFEALEEEIHSAAERLVGLATVSDRSAEQIAASALKKIDFEISRVRGGLVAAYKKKALSEHPILRKAGDFLLPVGALQERSLCSVAPLLYGEMPFLGILEALADTHISDVLGGRVLHQIFPWEFFRRSK